jgi:hypothetical protein
MRYQQQGRVRWPRIGMGGAMVLAIILFHPRPALSIHDPADPLWGCYDPEPGHPTAGERTAFFEKIGEPTRLAEQRYGVPAAGLAGMSMLESGYGFTRTAQFANNLFGWKAAQSDSASYVLTCQPASDPGNPLPPFRELGGVTRPSRRPPRDTSDARGVC